MILTYYILLCEQCPETDLGTYGCYLAGARTPEQDEKTIAGMASQHLEEHPDHEFVITVTAKDLDNIR